MKKVLCVFGTRPEAIKMAPVIKELHRSGKAVCRVVVTAQHREMLDQVLRLFEIECDYDLDIMKADQTLSYVTAAVITEIEKVILAERPDWVLVQGDTTTTMAASLAAFYQKVRVGHVEAGLRTWNKYQPFPEEVNRRVTGVIADLHFAPTELAMENLLRDGIPEKRIAVTGNTVIDAIMDVANRRFDPDETVLNELPLGTRRIILVTAHRRENIGEPLENICEALKGIAAGHEDDLHIVYPVHPNPNIHGPVHQRLGRIPNITLLPPLDYQPFVWLMKNSYLVLTDSGGLQEEAPGLGVPVLVLRNVTERPEGVAAGTVKIIGVEKETIIREVEALLDDKKEYMKMARAVNPFGDGRAGQRIVDMLIGAQSDSNIPLKRDKIC